MDKKILITGGAGYIGSSLVNLLIKKKYKVINVDDLSNNRKYKIIKGSDFYKIDITEKTKIEKIFQDNKIDTVFHLAGKLKISESQKNKKKYFFNNYQGTKILTELCNKYKVNNFVFASSCSVYGSSKKKFTENLKLKPFSNYAKSKKKSEEIIIKNFSKNNNKYIILRYFNIVGANLGEKNGELSNNDHVIKNFSKEFLKNKPIFKIYGDSYKTQSGTCVRDYLHITDLDYIHYKILKFLESKKRKNLIINCGTSIGYSIYTLYKKFSKKLYNSKLLIYKKRPGDIAIAVANNRKLRNIVGKNYKFKNIDYIIKNSIKWEKYLKKLSI